MKIKSITIKRGSTINLGNYESARYDVEATAELDEKDTWAKVFKALDKKVKDGLAEIAQDSLTK